MQSDLTQLLSQRKEKNDFMSHIVVVNHTFMRLKTVLLNGVCFNF